MPVHVQTLPRRRQLPQHQTLFRRGQETFAVRHEDGLVVAAALRAWERHDRAALPLPQLDDAADVAFGGREGAADADDPPAVGAELDAAHRPARRHRALRQRLARCHVPHAHRHIAAAAGHVLTVAAEGNALGNPLVTLQLVHLLARLETPDAHRLVAGCRDHPFPVRAEREPVDLPLMAGEVPYQRTGIDVPHLRGLVL